MMRRTIQYLLPKVRENEKRPNAQVGPKSHREWPRGYTYFLSYGETSRRVLCRTYRTSYPPSYFAQHRHLLLLVDARQFQRRRNNRPTFEANFDRRLNKPSVLIGERCMARY